MSVHPRCSPMNEDGTVTPEVTVIMAAWNAQATVVRAIRSALDQTVPLEIVVVDDCSSDRTLALIEELAMREPRLKVLRQAYNQGPAAARNRALVESRAEWVTVLDSDDWMESGRLAALLAFARHRNADFVADDIWKIDEGSPVSERRAMLGDVGDPQILSAERFVSSNLTAEHGGRREMGFLKPLMRRQFLLQNELRYDEAIRLGEDYVLYTKALLDGAVFVLVPPAGYVATVRSTSLSGRHATDVHARLAAADRDMLCRQDLPAATKQALEAHLLEQRRKLAWRQLIDAVRDADPVAAARCFWAPPRVVVDLLSRLTRESITRVRQRVGMG